MAKAEVVQADAAATVAKTAAVAAKITAEATAAAANSDPMLNVNTAHNEPRVVREVVILDPKILAEDAAVKEAITAAKARVAAEPKIKA